MTCHLDFVKLTASAKERELLEAALLTDIERFMLALGEGFYFAGRQRSLQVGGEELLLDLPSTTIRLDASSSST